MADVNAQNQNLNKQNDNINQSGINQTNNNSPNIINSDPAAIDHVTGNPEDLINTNLNRGENNDLGGSMSENNLNNEGDTADEENEDLFEGDYEEYQDKCFYGDPSYSPAIIEDYSSVVTNRRSELFKIVISRSKREFEAQITFNDKGPGEEGNGNNFEFKSIRANEFPSADKAILEMGFQTNNEAYDKGYQVPRKRMQNALTQVEKGLSDIMDKLESKVNLNLNDPAKLNSMESFLLKVRSRMEEALQSNETIDIFQNDFELSRAIHMETTNEKKQAENEVEIRSFRDNLLAGKYFFFFYINNHKTQKI